MALDLNDKSGNGNTITNSGADEITTSLPFAAKTEAAQIVRANKDYLKAADSPSLSTTGSITIEFWVKFNSLPASGGGVEPFIFIGKYDDGTAQRSYQFWIEYNGTSYNLLWINTSSGSWMGNKLVTWSPSPSTGTWYHLAVVLDTSANEVRFYVNGSQMGASQAPVATSIYDSTASVGIGVGQVDSNPSVTDRRLNGILTEVRIWNVVRTPAQIMENMNQLLTGGETGLVAYWPFQATLKSATTGYLKERYHNREDMGGYSL